MGGGALIAKVLVIVQDSEEVKIDRRKWIKEVISFRETAFVFNRGVFFFSYDA